MKILHFIASKGLGRGEAYIDLVNELCKHIDIILLIPKNALYKERIAKNIKVIEYSALNSRKNPLLLMEILWKIKKEKPDIVHTHFAKASEIFYFVNKFLQLPHVATKHNPRKGKIYNKIPNVIAVSKAVRESISNDNVKIIYNGIKQEQVSSSNKNNIFTILAVGRLDKIKGFDILIGECAKLDFLFQLQIVGEGEERKNLETLIRKLNLEDKVTLMGFRKDIPQIMSNSNMVIMSSHSEGFSLVMIEALFYAKLFISTKVSGATEILDEKFLIDGFHISDKLNKIYKREEEFINDFSLFSDRIKDQFRLENISQTYISYYKRFLKRNF